MAFLASNELREVTLDVELENFQGANGVYFVNTTAPIVTRGRLAARNCSVSIFDGCPGYLDLTVDLEDCTGRPSTWRTRSGCGLCGRPSPAA